jgi:hypothetical protein
MCNGRLDPLPIHRVDDWLDLGGELTSLIKVVQREVTCEAASSQAVLFVSNYTFVTPGDVLDVLLLLAGFRGLVPSNSNVVAHVSFALKPRSYISSRSRRLDPAQLHAVQSQRYRAPALTVSFNCFQGINAAGANILYLPSRHNRVIQRSSGSHEVVEALRCTSKWVELESTHHDICSNVRWRQVARGGPPP